MTTTPLLYTLKQAAEATPYSERTFRRAVKKIRDDGEFPHPCHSKRGSKGEYLIPESSLRAWIDALPDA